MINLFLEYIPYKIFSRLIWFIFQCFGFVHTQFVDQFLYFGYVFDGFVNFFAGR